MDVQNKSLNTNSPIDFITFLYKIKLFNVLVIISQETYFLKH